MIGCGSGCSGRRGRIIVYGGIRKMYIINTNSIIMAASVVSALAVIFSAVFAVHRWYLRQNQQDKEIENMKAEQCLLTYGILACLKGL